MMWWNRFKQWWTGTTPFMGIDFGSKDGNAMVIGHVKKGTLYITGTLFQPNKQGDYEYAGDIIPKEAMKRAIEQFSKGARTGRFNTQQVNHSAPPKSFSVEGVVVKPTIAEAKKALKQAIPVARELQKKMNNPNDLVIEGDDK